MAGQRDVVAAAFKGLPALEAILGQHPELLEARDGVGETPLHFLAIENQLEAVVFLVGKGADANAHTKFGSTPLMSAAGLGYYELVSYLLSLNPDINARDENGQTALFYAASTGHLECMDLLLSAGADPAIDDGLYSIFEVALDEHADKVRDFLLSRGLKSSDFPSPL